MSDNGVKQALRAHFTERIEKETGDKIWSLEQCHAAKSAGMQEDTCPAKLACAKLSALLISGELAYHLMQQSGVHRPTLELVMEKLSRLPVEEIIKSTDAVLVDYIFRLTLSLDRSLQIAVDESSHIVDILYNSNNN